MTSRLITDLGCYRQVSGWFLQLKSSSRQNCINLLGFLGYSNLICKNTWSQQACENVRNTLPRTMHISQGVSLNPLEFPNASKTNPQLQPTASSVHWLAVPFPLPCPCDYLIQTIHLEYHSTSSVTIKIMTAIYYYNGMHLFPHLSHWKIYVSILQMKNQRFNKVKQCIHNIQPKLELAFKLWSV